VPRRARDMYLAACPYSHSAGYSQRPAKAVRIHDSASPHRGSGTWAVASRLRTRRLGSAQIVRALVREIPCPLGAHAAIPFNIQDRNHVSLHRPDHSRSKLDTSHMTSLHFASAAKQAFALGPTRGQGHLLCAPRSGILHPQVFIILGVMMHGGSAKPVRFWVESVACVFSAVLLCVTLAVPVWIEAVFYVDPDHGGGVLEWGVALATAAASFCTLILARKDWRRPESTPTRL
jgi:hypothetical protein